MSIYLRAMPYVTRAELSEIVPDLRAMASAETSLEVRAALNRLADRYAAMAPHPTGAEQLGRTGDLKHEGTLQVTRAVQPRSQAKMALEQRARAPEHVEQLLARQGVRHYTIT